MKISRPERKRLQTTESDSPARRLVWLVVILVALTGVLFFAYRVQRQLSPAEYEGKIVDKWVGYNHSETGSRAYFRLLVEADSGQRTTVAVDQETYERANVGMWIRKTKRGIELSSLTASPPDVRKRLCPSVKAVLLVTGAAPRAGHSPEFFRGKTAGQSRRLTSGGEAVKDVDLEY